MFTKNICIDRTMTKENLSTFLRTLGLMVAKKKLDEIKIHTIELLLQFGQLSSLFY